MPPKQKPTSKGKLKVTVDSLNVRRSASLQGAIVGSLSQGDIVDWLDLSPDGNWCRIKKANLTGWSSPRFLIPEVAAAPPGPLDEIIQIAGSSAIAGYSWKNRGVAPRGYIKGMALVYARAYCKLKAGDAAAVEMAKANTGDTSKDALAWYAQVFQNAGMNNEAAGVNTLRHLFVLLIGLGMRESSGRYCEGRDRSANNTGANTAEAGMFQVSFDARIASPLLPQLFQQYKAKPTSGFVDVFKEGVTPTAKDLENFGTGDGRDFQQLCKECPAFAAEFAAVGLRNIRKHWGPIINRAAEVRPEANLTLTQVEHAVDISKLCPVVT
jgi:hypothetical protein